MKTTKKRVIRVANDKLVPLGQFVKAWKTVLASPPGTTFKSSLSGWWPATREEILGQFSFGVHDRINIRAGEPWRSVTTQEENELRHDQRDLHDHTQQRIRIYGFRTELCREMFSHHLADRNEI